FGWYDGTFGAAGDTEFKNRVLPFLKTKCVPQLLGVFLNYPEERTTASPRAEIEDTRAWYLHHALGGVRYAFQNRDPADAEKLLLLALNYRKSYVQHPTRDVEYALNVADYLSDVAPDSPALCLAQGAAVLLDAYRALDSVPSLAARAFAETIHKTRTVAARVQADHRATSWLQQVRYEIFND